jgi:hypothetical protein
MKVKFHYDYPISLDIDCNKEVNVYIDQFTLEDIPPDSLRIVILQEPWRSPMIPLVQKYKGYYTHLLTYQDEVLQTNPKARLFHFPNTWVKGYVPGKKEFNVSTVVGGKNIAGLEGHELRHELWRKRDMITIPKKFYLSGNAKHSHTFEKWDEVDYKGQLVLGTSKEPLFDSMFHIAIENTSIKNYFSEKIIDCFQTKTVPIYYGCKNIEEYFNIEGIYTANSLQTIISICNQLTSGLYEKLLPAINDNFERSNKWCDQMLQLKNGITLILKEEGVCLIPV